MLCCFVSTVFLEHLVHHSPEIAGADFAGLRVEVADAADILEIEPQGTLQIVFETRDSNGFYRFFEEGQFQGPGSLRFLPLGRQRGTKQTSGPPGQFRIATGEEKPRWTVRFALRPESAGAQDNP